MRVRNRCLSPSPVGRACTTNRWRITQASITTWQSLTTPINCSAFCGRSAKFGVAQIATPLDAPAGEGGVRFACFRPAAVPARAAARPAPARAPARRGLIQALALNYGRAVEAPGDELLPFLAVEPASVRAAVAVLHLLARGGLLLRALRPHAVAHEAAPLGALQSALVRVLGTGLVLRLVRGQARRFAVAPIKAVRHEATAFGAGELLLLRLRIARAHALLVRRQAIVGRSRGR